MEKHVMTKEQARRLGVSELADKEVDVVLYQPNEKPDDLANHRMAKEVYLNGKYLGGCLNLEA